MSEKVKVIVATSFLVACTAAHAQQDGAPVQEQVQGVESNSQTYVHPDPELPTPQQMKPTIESESAADHKRRLLDQQLTDMFKRGEYAAVRKKISDIRKSMPGWEPPAWMTVELKRAEVRAKIAAAKNDLGQLIELSKRYPEQFSCREYYNLWLLADAHAALDEKKVASDIYHQMLASCNDSKVLLITLDRIAGSDGAGQALAAETEIEKRGLRLPPKELEQRLYNWRISQAVALHGEGKLVEAGTYLAAIEPTVIQRRDLDLGRLIAWNYKERGETAAAIKWFERLVQWSGAEDDRLHLLQLQWDTGDHAAVIASVRRQSLKDASARLWAAEILRGEAARVFDTHDYAESVALLDDALAYNKPEPVSLTSLRGWACLELNRYTDARNAFTTAYRSAPDPNLASGLIYAAQRGGDWNALITIADNTQGPLLSNEGERDLVKRLAEGTIDASQVTAEEGHLVIVDPEAKTPMVIRALKKLDGIPGYTWGSLDGDSKKNSSLSFLVNQGVDWIRFPGDITLNTYVEYRAINNDTRYLLDETDGALGVQLNRSPFHLGMEYLPKKWQNNSTSIGSDRKAFFSWYFDWYKYLRRRTNTFPNPFNVDAYSGSTYGRVTRDLDIIGENGGTTEYGFIKQGLDWFTFHEDITFDTYAVYRFRNRTWNDYYYDSQGPAVGMELQKPPFALGVDYSWKWNRHTNVTTKGVGVYLNWYYGWDLKPE